jgi:hypothetical protein
VIRRATCIEGLIAASFALVLLMPFVPGTLHAQDETRKDRVYLSELSLLIEGSRRLLSFCATHADDPELAKFAYPLAERYVEMANRMLPTQKVAVVHPHLLLVVENLERALDSAAVTNTLLYQKRVRTAREELSNVDAVLKQLKLRLPELPR